MSEITHAQATFQFTINNMRYSINVERTQIDGQLAYASSICSADLSFHVCHTVVEENLFFNLLQAVIESPLADSVAAARRCVLTALEMRK